MRINQRERQSFPMHSRLHYHVAKHLTEVHAFEMQSIQLLSKGEKIGGQAALQSVYRACDAEMRQHARLIERRLESPWQLIFEHEGQRTRIRWRQLRPVFPSSVRHSRKVCRIHVRGNSFGNWRIPIAETYREPDQRCRPLCWSTYGSTSHLELSVKLNRIGRQCPASVTFGWQIPQR